MAALSPEDAVLDRLWRAAFNQPLPIRGAADHVKRVLISSGVAESVIRAAIRAQHVDGDAAGASEVGLEGPVAGTGTVFD